MNPIPPEFLDSQRKTILEFKDGKKGVKAGDWKASVKTKQFHSPQSWKGRTVVKILPGGIENRTSVKVRSTASGPKRRGKLDDDIIKPPMAEPAKSSGSSHLRQVPTTRKSKKGPASKGKGKGLPVRPEPVLKKKKKTIHSRIWVFNRLSINQEATILGRYLNLMMIGMSTSLQILEVPRKLQSLLQFLMRLSQCLPEVKH